MKYSNRIRAGTGIFILLAVLLSTVLVASTRPAQAQDSGVQSCALTPNLLGGQGFTLSGQGFTLSGQGFTLSGQGFTLSGQGFTLSGQGIDPVAVANEVLNNKITVGKWVDDRLGFFLNKLGFNTDSTAILVIDEFNAPDAHGVEVQQVVQDALNSVKQSVPDLKVDVFPIDISDANTNYNADAIANKITARVNELKTTYRHFVLNMSFGLIACQDAGPVLDGQQMPSFDFNQALQAINANNQPQPSLGVAPVLECVFHPNNPEDDMDDDYIAYFGYKNDNAKLVSIPLGGSNTFSYKRADRGQPTSFEPGSHHYVFAASFEGSLTWTLTGPDNQPHPITVNGSSTPCPAPIPQPNQPITPVVECVANPSTGVYKARFGYSNPNQLGSNIPVGANNQFSGTADQGQITTFAPGVHHSVFEVAFDGNNLSWALNGSTVTANSSSPACGEQSGFSIGQYLTQILGVPENLVDDYVRYLADKAQNDSLQSLRLLLKNYLQISADPYQNFSAVAIASSGNLRPWLGGAPLAPASWPETIAVGATLDDSDVMWSFSQNGNVVAPGAGYPFSDNHYGAGTSFAAPVMSVLTGLCSTVPHALHFDGTLPPLMPPVVDSAGHKILSNTPINAATLNPLACSPNNNPTIDSIPDRSDYTGTNVSISVTAHDADGDALTFNATGLPAGITINSQGTISGLLGSNTVGSYTVTVTVTDDGEPQGQATTTFHWTVNPPPVKTVGIDIKPQSPVNTINLKSHGTIRVAVLGSASFVATTVNPLSVTVAGAPVVIKNGLPVTWTENVNGDAYTDFVVRVRVDDLQLTAASTEAVLKGTTYSGQAIQGKDIITIVPPGSPNNISPGNGTNNIKTSTPVLSWVPINEEEEAPTCYQVVIANNSSFTNPVQNATVIQLQTYTTYQLANGTYYWHVAISDCAGNAVSPWSATWSFKINAR